MTGESVTAIYIDLRRNRARCYFGDYNSTVDFDLRSDSVRIQDLANLGIQDLAGENISDRTRIQAQDLKPTFDRVPPEKGNEFLKRLIEVGFMEAVRQIIKLVH